MTARTAVPGLGPLESAIMTVLWNASRPLKPQEVRDQIDYHEVGYTTVASVLTILRDKEMTRRARQGRAYLYEAAVSRDQHLGRIVRAALDAADDPGLRPRPRLVHRLRSQSWLGRGLSPGVGSWNGREYLCGPASGSADPGFLRRASGLARSGRMSLAVGSGTLLDDLSVHNWAEESPAARITGCAGPPRATASAGRPAWDRWVSWRQASPERSTRTAASARFSAGHGACAGCTPDCTRG